MIPRPQICGVLRYALQPAAWAAALALAFLLGGPACLVNFGARPGDGGVTDDVPVSQDASALEDVGIPDGTLPDVLLPDGGPNCGNGVVDSDEECDDGNASNTDACTNACRAARCGDYVIYQGVEECDDGNQSNSDACLTDCRSARCGDGFVWQGFEGCDDEDTQGGDGCSSTCQVENGYVCEGQPSVCHTVCGDGIVRGNEACDDGNLVDGDGCSSACTPESLPTLHWVGGTGVWTSQLLTYAYQPHAPEPSDYPIVAAAAATDNREAFVFTESTYHVLDLSSRQFVDSGSLGSMFPGMPPPYRTLHSAMGASFGTTADIYFMVDDLAYLYTYDFASGTASANSGNPFTLTHWTACCGASVPSAASIRASWFDPLNTLGWTSGSYATICNPSCPCGASSCDTGTVGPYDAHITTSGQIYLKDLGCCDRFFSQMTASSFPPFSYSGAPSVYAISAAFYDGAVDRLYVITDP